jgi:hypothetical protein
MPRTARQMRESQRYCKEAPSCPGPGTRSRSEILFVSKEEIPSLQIWCCSVPRNQRACATLKPVTWTGKGHIHDTTPNRHRVLYSAPTLSTSRPLLTGTFDPLLSHRSSETNLKIKQALPETVHLITPLEASNLGGLIRSEQPNNSLYTFEGTLLMNRTQGTPKELPLDPTQILLRV